MQSLDPELVLTSFLKDGLIDIGYDERGCRQFLRWNDVLKLAGKREESGRGEKEEEMETEVEDKKEELAVFEESELDLKKAKIFNSIFYYTNAIAYGFNVIDDLSLHAPQKEKRKETENSEEQRSREEDNWEAKLLIISDFSTLTKASEKNALPTNIELIVNCQLNEVDLDMYRGLYRCLFLTLSMFTFLGPLSLFASLSCVSLSPLPSE